MTRRFLATLLLLLSVPALALAQNRYESDCDSTADFTSTSGVTFTSAGKCGGAVVLDADSDVAAWAAIGTTHCTPEDTLPECTAAGEQIHQITLQYWYSCDTNGDGTCDVAPAYSSHLLGRDQGSYTPTILKYDGSSPVDTFRTYNVVAQHTLSGVDLMDGQWHKIRYTYDIDANKRKLCIDDVCVEDTTDAVYGFAAGANSLVGFLSSSDPDLCWGAYDEFQVALGYDVTFDSDGPGCSTEVPPEEAANTPTQDTNAIETRATSFVSGGCGTIAHMNGCKMEVEIRADQDDKSPLFYHALVPILGETSFRTSIVYDKPWEFGERYARTRCQTGSDCSGWGNWSQWAEWFGDAQAPFSDAGATHGVVVYHDDFDREPGNVSGQDPEVLDGGEVGWTGNVSYGADEDNRASFDFNQSGRVVLHGNTLYFVRRKLPGSRFVAIRSSGQAGGNGTLEFHVALLSTTGDDWHNVIRYHSAGRWEFIDENGTTYVCDDSAGSMVNTFYRFEVIERDDGKHALRRYSRPQTSPDTPWSLDAEVIAEDDCADWAGKTLPWGPGYVGIGSMGASNYTYGLEWFECGPLSATGHPAASRRAP